MTAAPTNSVGGLLGIRYAAKQTRPYTDSYSDLTVASRHVPEVVFDKVRLPAHGSQGTSGHLTRMAPRLSRGSHDGRCTSTHSRNRNLGGKSRFANMEWCSHEGAIWPLSSPHQARTCFRNNAVMKPEPAMHASLCSCTMGTLFTYRYLTCNRTCGLHTGNIARRKMPTPKCKGLRHNIYLRPGFLP